MTFKENIDAVIEAHEGLLSHITRAGKLADDGLATIKTLRKELIAANQVADDRLASIQTQGFIIEDIGKTKAAAIKELHELTASYGEMQTRALVAECQRDEARDDLKSTAGDLKGKLSAVQDLLDALRGDHATALRVQCDLRKQVDELTKKLDEAKRARGLGVFNAVKAERDQARIERDSARGQSYKVSGDLDTANATAREARTELDQATARFATSRGNYEKTINSLTEERDNLRAELAATSQRLCERAVDPKPTASLFREWIKSRPSSPDNRDTFAAGMEAARQMAVAGFADGIGEAIKAIEEECNDRA